MAMFDKMCNYLTLVLVIPQVNLLPVLTSLKSEIDYGEATNATTPSLVSTTTVTATIEANEASTKRRLTLLEVLKDLSDYNDGFDDIKECYKLSLEQVEYIRASETFAIDESEAHPDRIQLICYRLLASQLDAAKSVDKTVPDVHDLVNFTHRWRDDFPWRFRGDIDCARKDLVDKIDFRSILAFEKVLTPEPHHHYSQSEMCNLYMRHREERRSRRYWHQRFFHSISMALSVKFLNRYAGVAVAVLALGIGLRCFFSRRCKTKRPTTASTAVSALASSSSSLSVEDLTLILSAARNPSSATARDRRRRQRRRRRRRRVTSRPLGATAALVVAPESVVLQMRRMEEISRRGRNSNGGMSSTTLQVALPPAYSPPETPAPTYEEALASSSTVSASAIVANLTAIAEEVVETASLPPSYDEAIKQINC